MKFTITQEDLQFGICRNCLRGFISPELGWIDPFCGKDCEDQFNQYPWDYDENVKKVIWRKEVPKSHPLLKFSYHTPSQDSFYQK